MSDFSSLPRRKSPRLQGYDYRQPGVYFVTICTHERGYLFGEIVNGAMIFNDLGIIASKTLARLPAYWQPQIELDACIVMPNHVHAIIVLVGTAFLSYDVGL